MRHTNEMHVLAIVIPRTINAATLINNDFLYFTSNVVLGFLGVLYKEGQLLELPTKEEVVEILNATRCDMFHGNVGDEPRLWAGNILTDYPHFIPEALDLGSRFRHYVLAVFPWQSEKRALKHLRKSG